ncbi:ParA family protein [Aquipuribacter sp. SD81]|uniref:ParA family protein n=1 Tax=Aquipuribacter sp. SD81 TaxID=3127703 RepID=UPI003FA5E53E
MSIASDGRPEEAPVDYDGLGPTGRPVPDFGVPPVLGSHGPARVIALCNQKGGVGKTTTTMNLGAALAEYGRRVLLVDFDPQGALSANLGVRPEEGEPSLYQLLVDRDLDVRTVVRGTSIEGIDVLPTDIHLSAAEVHLVSEVAREMVLKRLLRPLLDDYDVVLIDCQPSLGLLAVNALTAAHGVLIPVECEYFALRGVALLQQTIEKVTDRLNYGLEIDGVLPTMYDSRTLHSREVVARLVDVFGDKVFHTVISRTVKFPDSSAASQPMTTYAPTHPGTQAYRQLARELVARGLVA